MTDGPGPALRADPPRPRVTPTAVRGTAARCHSTAESGAVDAIVFAPLNKHALHLAGLAEEDELRYMQRFFAVDGFVSEFNITGALWTSRVTSHVPLREFADAITTDGVVDAVRILHRYQVAAGTASPRIAVTALNIRTPVTAARWAARRST